MDVSSGTGGQQTQTIQEGQPSSSNPAPTNWPGLDKIVNKVANPTEIYECLRCRAPDGTSPTRLGFLTRLFFLYGGAYAFAETGAALSAFYQTEDNDITTVGGTVRAVVRTKFTNAIEQRAFLVRLCKDRFERQETWKRQKQPRGRRPHQPSNGRKVQNRADIMALRGMMECAFHPLSALLSILTSFNFRFSVPIMDASQQTLHIPQQNTTRDSHIDLGLIGRGRSPLTQEFHARSRSSPTTTTQRIAAGDTSAQDGASQPKETGISIGDQHSSGFPQAIRGEQEGSRVQHGIP